MWEIPDRIVRQWVRYKSFYTDAPDFAQEMLAGQEFVGDESRIHGRNGRVVVRQKGVSVTILVPTLFEMAKSVMRMRCALEKAGSDSKTLEELSKVESALMKVTVDIEYLRRKGN